MKAKFGAIVTSGSGKLGGGLFQGSRTGVVFKNKTSPLVKNSSSRYFRRAAMSSVSSGWSLLSEPERFSWLSVKMYNKTGYSLYMSVNNLLLNAGLPVVSIPPSPLALVDIPNNGAYIDISDQAVFIAMATLAYDGFRASIFCTPSVKSSVKLRDRDYIYLGSSVIVSGGLDFTNLFLNRFKAIPLSGNYYTKAVFMNTDGNIVSVLVLPVTIRP